MLKSWLSRLLIVILLATFLPSQGSAGAQLKTVKRILILNDLGTLASPGFALIDQAIYTGVQKSSYQIEFYNESLETTLFPDDASQRRIRDAYLRKYAERKPDVIIAAGTASIEFMIETHEKFFPNIPIIFCGTTEEMLRTLKLDSHFTGAWGVADPEGTLKVALRLRPATRRIVVTGGVGAFDRDIQKIVRDALQKHESQFEFTYLTDLDMATLLDRLRQLPDNSIVFHTSIMLDASGARFIDASQSLPMVAAAANAPVFVVDDVDVGNASVGANGSVGGHVLSWAAQASVAAEMAVRVLDGERVENIPIAKTPSVYVFDSRAFERWGFKERDFPPGSTFLYRPTSVWDSYKWYIIGAVSLMLVETLLILELVWLRKRRSTIESALTKSEEKFSKAFRQSPLAISLTTAKDGRYIDVNDSFERVTGWRRDAVIGRTPFDLEFWVDPEERVAIGKRLLSGEVVRNFETRNRLKNGEARTCLVSAELIEIGKDQCVLAVIADVTERKLAEEALSTVSRKLIEAHEEERAWLARELHDDISQRLCLLTMNLATLKNGAGASAQEVREGIKEAMQQVNNLAGDMQALSRRLHSSKLDYLGLEAAAAGYCSELADQHGVEIDLRAEHIARDVSHDISLSIFRVLQQALQNAITHSGVRRFEVSLGQTFNAITLTVHDSGKGFDVAEAMKGRGLGLTSMRERVSLVDGELSIDSQPQTGTTIRVRVPLVPKLKAAGGAA